MDFNFISNIESCHIELSPVLYYSHIPTALVALLLGIFVYLRSRTLASGALLAMSTFFALWSFVDIVLWTSVNGSVIMFYWPMLYFLQGMILLSAIFFSYTFLEKKEPPFWSEVFGGLLISPLIIFLSTDYLVTGFDVQNCEAIQGRLTQYSSVVQIIVLLWIIIYFFMKYWRTVDLLERGRQRALFFGIFFFLIAFSWGNLFGSLTLQWGTEQYGLFGMPVFIGFLAYLIVKFQAFNIKLLGAQALVVSLALLIGSQFFFVKTNTNFILTGITFSLTICFGWFLVRSVRNEVERKEELQMMSDRLAVANQELKRLDNAKSEFISIASHQLRTPLTAIKGYTSLILEGSYGKVDNQIQDVINKVYSANSRLIELVENLLSISRLESGRMQYNFQLGRLEDIVKETMSMFAVIAKNRGIQLEMILPEMPLPLLSLDAGKIREVISNLIDNAVKYSEKGLVTVTVEQVNDEKVRLSVKDTGIGIKQEDLEHIFLKFARSKETEKLYVGGTGLGLYVGRTFIEKHGGRLWAESEGHGHGASFIFELPISRDSV